MPIPTFVNAGTQAQTATNGGTGPVTPGLPANWAVNDILILFVETANEPVSATTGYSNVGTGVIVQATGLVTALTVRWKRAVGGETAPSVSIASGNHVIARLAAFRGCVTTGSPINATAVFADNATGTGFSVPGATTTATDCLIVAGLSTGTDVTSTTMTSGWTSTSTFANPSLTEFFDNWHVTGNGGGFGAAYGGRAASGAYNAITGSLTTGNTKATMSFALQGAAAAATPPITPVVETRSIRMRDRMVFP